MIALFQEDVIAMTANQSNSDEEVFQLNVQLFPLTKKTSEDPK